MLRLVSVSTIQESADLTLSCAAILIHALKQPGHSKFDAPGIIMKAATKHRPAVSACTSVEDNTQLMADFEREAIMRRRRLLEQGELLTRRQLCERLGITPRTLAEAVWDHRLFWIDGDTGEHWYPGFFADSASHLPDIERVSIALGELPGAVKWQVFTTLKYSLGGNTPIAVLRTDWRAFSARPRRARSALSGVDRAGDRTAVCRWPVQPFRCRRTPVPACAPRAAGS